VEKVPLGDGELGKVFVMVYGEENVPWGKGGVREGEGEKLSVGEVVEVKRGAERVEEGEKVAPRALSPPFGVEVGEVERLREREGDAVWE